MNPGRIVQLNVSPGGVPKRSVAYADVEANGIVGDAVKLTKIHGGPERAVCLYSLERLLALQAEGKPVFPGALGENVTVTGLDWDHAVPGARFVSGDVELEVTRFAVPCSTTAIYTNGDKTCYSQDHRPGWSRVYTKVLRRGRLLPGQAIRLDPT